jgi:NADPH-dependent curcumin reductase CurA
MGDLVAKKIVLAAYPGSQVKESDLRTETVAVAEPREGEILLCTKYLSLDPYMRARMEPVKSYAPYLNIGDVIVGQSICEVLSSRHSDFQIGDIVIASTGWRTLTLSNGEGIRKLDPTLVPVTFWLGVLGNPGFAAYVGLQTISRPKHGETVVVAAASGGVGALVGQLARKAGARTVGIVGSAQKCEFIKNELGFDVAVDHRSNAFGELLGKACPTGVDVYFENVGGPVLAAVWPLLNSHARIPICGLVGQFGQPAPAGPDRLPGAMRQILSKSLIIRGFLVSTFGDLRPQFEAEIIIGLKDGTIHQREDITEGFDQTAPAFIRMLEGRSFGKSIVKI